MKPKIAFILFGMAFTILLVSRSTDAAILGYTKSGYTACASLIDFEKMETFYLQRDSVAVDKMIKQGRCILLQEGIRVYAWNPLYGTHPKWAKIRLPGSTESLWTFWEAVEEEGKRDQRLKGNPMSKTEWLILDSFLWIKPGKTEKQQIFQRYGEPAERDERFILYKTSQHEDFREYKKVKFVINSSGIVEQIRVEK